MTLDQLGVNSAYIKCKSIITAYISVMVDPESQHRQQCTLARAIPERWGDMFPLVYQIPKKLLKDVGVAQMPMWHGSER